MKDSKEIRSLKTHMETIQSASETGQLDYIELALELPSTNSAYIEFAQKMKAIKYREARDLASSIASERGAKKEYIKKMRKSSGGRIKGVNIVIQGEEERIQILPFPTEAAGLYGEIEHFTADKREELIDLQAVLHAENPDLVKTLKSLQSAVEKRHKLSHITNAITEWSKKSLQDGVLLTNLKNYILRKQDKAKSKFSYLQPPMSKNIALHVTNEVQACDDLGMTVGEFEAFLFLFWKAFNMDERELYIKESWIDKYKATEDEIVCVFRASSALKSAFGDNIKFNDRHYDRLNKSLTSLYEKKRKIVLQRGSESVEVKIRLIEQLELRHKLNDGEEFNDYIVCAIPKEIVDLPQAQYTKIRHDLVSLIRNTPPETRTVAPLVKFILLLVIEQSYQQKRMRPVKRKKDKLDSSF